MSSTHFRLLCLPQAKKLFILLPICDQWIENEYGSCSGFEEHDIAVCNLNKVALQANADEMTHESECETVLDFAQTNSIPTPASS